MMKQAFLLLLSVLMLPTLRLHAEELTWGSPTNGLSVGIEQVADKAISVRFRNDSTTAFFVLTESLWWHCDLLVDGKRVTRQDDYDDIILPVLTVDSFVRIEPGKVLEQRLELRHWEPIPAGEFRLRYRNTQMMRQKNDGKEFGLKVWMGIAFSNPLKMKAANKSVDHYVSPAGG